MTTAVAERPNAISRMELFDTLRNTGVVKPTLARSREHLRAYVKSKFYEVGFGEDVERSITDIIDRFTLGLNKRWMHSHRNSAKLLKNHSEWLNAEIVLPKFLDSKTTNDTDVPRGRPKKLFTSSSNRTKRRKVQDLVQSRTTDELSFAAETSLRSAGKRDAANILQEVTTNSPTRATKMKKAYVSSKYQKNITPVPYTVEEALSLIVKLKLTKHQYQTMRTEAKNRNADIYPAYNLIRQAKQSCYPPKEHIKITDTSVEVVLQNLLNHTAERITTVQEEVLDTYLPEIIPDSLELIYKWGCDGSSGQSTYKQKFTEQNTENCNDSELFVTSIVPLRLHAKSTKSTADHDEKLILWRNPRPSSTRFCRPIRFQFLKETPDVIRNEIDHIDNQIKDLQLTKCLIRGNEFHIKHNLVLSMIDGKVCNAIVSNTSSQKCYICGSSPKDMNNLAKLNLKVSDESVYKFGLSTLHAWIRFFECLLHISYRLDLKKWQVRGQDKDQVEIRKKYIKTKFRLRLGLIVDQPKQGSGTTNNGNTARRFFNDPALSAEITGLDEQLIRRFAVILQALSSGFQINIEAFKKYATDTAKLYVSIYNWYYMPASVHKILLHGADVIKCSLLPIGELSEEASEARNKDFKNYRERHTRKSSRKNANEDILHALLISSDPLISSKGSLPKKKIHTLSAEVISLLAPSDPGMTDEHAENLGLESEDDSDSSE